jgi:hypothetical protein
MRLDAIFQTAGGLDEGRFLHHGFRLVESDGHGVARCVGMRREVRVRCDYTLRKCLAVEMNAIVHQEEDNISSYLSIVISIKKLLDDDASNLARSLG